MQKEYEFAFQFNKDEILEFEKFIISIGAKLDTEKIMYICVYDDPDRYIRIRDNKLTIKNDLNSKFVNEYETAINEIEMMKIFEMLGYQIKYKTEKYRKIYYLNDIQTEIVFDTYPGCPTYIEIECKTEDLLVKAIKHLKLDMKNQILNKDVYNHFYQIDKNRKIPLGSHLTFKNAYNIFKDIFPTIESEKKFINTLDYQLKLYF